MVSSALGSRAELVGIIDRTLTEAWASRHVGWHRATLLKIADLAVAQEAGIVTASHD